MLGSRRWMSRRRSVAPTPEPLSKIAIWDYYERRAAGIDGAAAGMSEDIVGDGGAAGMSRSDLGKSGRRVGVPLLAVGLAAGAALAYVVLVRRRPLAVEGLTAPCDDEVSLYMVGEDASTEWVGASIDEPGAAATGTEGDEESVRTRPNRLIDIEGIGPVYAQTLAGLGLRTTGDLLQAGADPKGREDLAATSSISKKLILRWVNQADLFRIKGVGEQYADLLEAAGVDTVPELAQRRADNLTKKMVEVNEQKRVVRRTPTEAQVAAWIESAKGLPRVVTY
jgi:predicted flap endonuclease-1-like 5' DNA nuclease